MELRLRVYILLVQGGELGVVKGGLGLLVLIQEEEEEEEEEEWGEIRRRM